MPVGQEKLKLLKALGLSLALGIATWLLAPRVLPAKLPQDFPGLPGLQSLSPPLRAELQSADREARRRPGSAEALGKLAMVYHANQMFEQAGGAYRIAARLASGDYRWVYGQAVLQEENGNEKEQVNLLRQTLQLNPGYVPALVKLGDWSFKVDQLDEAGRLYQAARGAAALQASFALGRVAERRREWKKVIEIIGALTGEYPQAAPPYELLRTAYAALGQADKAEDARQSAAAAEWKAIPPVDDPFLDQLMDLCHSATRLLKHAGLLSRTGYAERAIQVGRRAVEADPNDAGARDFLARTLLAFSSARPELLEEALAQLTECLRIKPADPVPLGGFATEFFKSPRPRPAVERLRSLLRGRSDIPGAHFLQGQAADALGEASEAAAEYQAALKESPNNSAIYNKLGLLAESSGQTGEALAHFRKALQINPLNTDARLNLAIELVQRSMVDQGIKELQELLRQNPHDAPAHFCLGFAFLSSRRIDEAIAQFSQGLRSQPRDPEARYGLALALAAKQRREEAVREVREALRLRPEYPAAQQLLRQLGQ